MRLLAATSAYVRSFPYLGRDVRLLLVSQALVGFSIGFQQVLSGWYSLRLGGPQLVGLVSFVLLGSAAVVAQSAVSPRWRGAMPGAAGLTATGGWAAASLAAGYAIPRVGFATVFVGCALWVLVSAAVFGLWSARPAPSATAT